ncbi:hypothetical protein [Bradyrhizobium erythrophlei]|jgi:hypothetical protein|uniref:hypothetical protein n=1 Tax=Bradyrhizobium erythrophlei TaxID=1437360 RepID=UPI0012EC633F|nr:hypothetical protein [Bradyrhizobium erythrophlei]
MDQPDLRPLLIALADPGTTDFRYWPVSDRSGLISLCGFTRKMFRSGGTGHSLLFIR